MRFEDAVKLVGRQQSGAVKALDYLLGGVLAVAAPFTGGATIGLFDPKNDLVRGLGDLHAQWSEKVRGTRNRHRGELLVAAHTIVVVSAYFDTVAAQPLLAGVTLLPRERDLLASAAAEDPERADMVGGLLRMEVPAPGPHRPFDVLMDHVHEHYSQMSRRLADFLRGLAYWDGLDETRRGAVDELLRDELPAAAMAGYRGRLGQFAAECPEFLFWTSVWEHTNTREQVRRAVPPEVYAKLDDIVAVLRETRTGLDGLGRLLRRLQPRGAAAPERWGELAHAYRDDFQRQLFEAVEHGAAADLDIPVLAHGYVNPAFRAVEHGPGASPSEDRWWRAHVTEVRQDIQGFLAGYLGSPVATELPLVLLGHPGAGKSVLTRALAAQLGASGYRPIRVDLRRVPADALIMDQIEHSLRDALHRDVKWDDLADTAGDSMPVVLLDGFDELLQGSSSSRSDYLERVREFQHVERRQSRPLAVVVTSRTVVAHRARIPRGATVLRLEPFDEPRVSAWLERWNEANAGYCASLDLQPLRLDTVWRHRHLAEQPLLLMMLALYDADGNALQRESTQIDQAELYERLLTTFVRREVNKTRAGASEDEVARLIDHELNQLSFAAFAMFNRASQFVSEKGLQQDLEVLLSDPGGQRRDDVGIGQALTAAQLLVGRFFFVHVARASFADPTARTPGIGTDELRTYEFLHATFSEYLVARLAVHAAVDLHNAHAAGRNRLVPTRAEPDDSVLHALLSFQPLTARAPIVGFVVKLARRDRALAARVHATLVELFRVSRRAVTTRRFDAYQPADPELPTRMAVYSLNVLLLLLATAEGGVRLADLFGEPEDAPTRWRQLALSWWACLDDEAWRSLLDEVGLVTDHGGAPVGVELRPAAERPAAVDRRGVADVHRSTGFVGDRALDRVLAGVLPLAELSDALFHPARTGGAPPVADVLRLLLDPEVPIRRFTDVVGVLDPVPEPERSALIGVLLRQPVARTARDPQDLPELLDRVTGERPRVAAEAIRLAAAHFGRDVIVDAVLRDRVAVVARAADMRELLRLEPALYLEVVLALEVMRPAGLPPAYGLEVALARVDLAPLARSASDLVRRTLSAARRRGLAPFPLGRGAAVLGELPSGVLAVFTPAEWAYLTDAAGSTDTGDRLALLTAQWRRIRQEAGLPVTAPQPRR
ncbi:NACHT domain-containing protein [Saccharothrix lopnurensis]|uniref:NACHT domain-containing protein n=1 Tax=Saccharothrix lopnurensis TaxID=1670621 RepID=A0ABW1PC00_9PSEU